MEHYIGKKKASKAIYPSNKEATNKLQDQTPTIENIKNKTERNHFIILSILFLIFPMVSIVGVCSIL